MELDERRAVRVAGLTDDGARSRALVASDMGTTILLPDLDSYCCVLQLEVPILLYYELAICILLYCNILQYAKTS